MYVDFDTTLTDNYTGASLVSNVKKMTDRTKNKCVFCNGSHWSDRCKIVADLQNRKEFLKINRCCFVCLKKGHLSKNCDKSKPCFFCKSSTHNSAICENKKDRKYESATNFVSEYSTIILQTVVFACCESKKQKNNEV